MVRTLGVIIEGGIFVGAHTTDRGEEGRQGSEGLMQEGASLEAALSIHVVTVLIVMLIVMLMVQTAIGIAIAMHAIRGRQGGSPSHQRR